MKVWLFYILIGMCFLFENSSVAKTKKSSPTVAEEIDVGGIKKKYWTRGDKSKVGVVQSRTFSKAKKFNLGVIGGTVISDPFLSTSVVGGSVGYHFNEFFGFHLLGWKSLVSDSTALKTFKESRGATANTNEPRSYLGGEGSASLIYGKLSFLNTAIIYYDLHLLGGAGMTATESGSYFTPHLGIGQRFFLAKKASLRFDYRIMLYRETIIEKEIPTKLGESQGDRNNWSNVVTLGLDFLVDF